MNLTFVVKQCTENKEGKFVWKLETNTSVECFGIKKSVKRTFYIGGMPAAVAIDTKFVENLDKFEIKEYAFPHPESGEMLQLKWLHAKPF